MKIPLACLLALVLAAPALAQSQCVTLCQVNCVKPISIPDRWDDTTPIAGYDGSVPKKPNWRNNGQLDQESFTDANANGLWDPGEPYVDGNGNGIFDHEPYDPLLTGYVPSRDLGLELTLQTGSLAPSPGQYLAIDYPPANTGTPITGSDPYRDNWSSCNSGLAGAGDACQIEPGSMSGTTNQLMRDLIAQDPDAYWDPVTSSVQGSAYPQSPRVIFFPIHDPRVPLSSGSSRIVITKVAAFFMEQMTGNASVRGRFMRAMGTGTSCAGDGFVGECPTPARATSWGRVKDVYR